MKAFYLAILLLLIGTSAESRSLNAIGISVADLGNPFFVEIVSQVKHKARRLVGEHVKIIVRSSAYDLKRQVKQIDSFIVQQVDLIILTAADSQLIEPAVRRAQKSGIVVVAVDINAAGADLTITTDNTQAGRLACQYLAERIEGKGKLVIINGASVSSVIDRVAGCRSVLKNHPGITLLSDQQNGGGSIEGGMESMTRLLNSFSSIQAVFAINDPSAEGAAIAAQQAGREDLIIASVDGAPRALQMIGKKESVWEATAAQFPWKMAELAVEQGLRLIQGFPVDHRVILIPAHLITRDNMDTYQGWGQ